MSALSFNSFTSMLSALPDDAACRAYLESKIWENGAPTCPHCRSKEHYILKTKGEFRRMYKCAAKGCKQRYTVTLGPVDGIYRELTMAAVKQSRA